MTSTEPELAVRADGRVLAPRLADATAAVPEPEVTSFEAGKMVENGGKLQGRKANRYEILWNDAWNGEQYRSMIYTVYLWKVGKFQLQSATEFQLHLEFGI